MSPPVKLGLYVVLTIGACVFGYLSWRGYHSLMDNVQSNNGNTVDVPALEGQAAKPAFQGYSKVMVFGIVFFVMVVGLGFLGGHDLSQFIGNRATKALFNDEGEGLRDPEYDRAEQEWADGHHLEAIRLMREYLQKNPRQVHAALRIAEIYEKDLQNHLAAALEYEEILKQSLPRERWGWAAIHLCNLYFKLGKADPAIALLQRIDAEYGETQAAEKARKRLALFETESAQGSDAGSLVEGDTPLDEPQKS